MKEVSLESFGKFRNIVAEELAYRVFERSLRLLGGPRKIIHGYLPSLRLL